MEDTGLTADLTVRLFCLPPLALLVKDVENFALDEGNFVGIVRGSGVYKLGVRIAGKSGGGLRTCVESLCLVCISILILDGVGGGASSTECVACAEAGSAWTDEGGACADVWVGAGELNWWGDWGAVGAAGLRRGESAGRNAVDATTTDEAVLAPYGSGTDCGGDLGGRVVGDILRADARAGGVVGGVAVGGHVVNGGAAGSAPTGGRGEAACPERVEEVECEGVLL